MWVMYELDNTIIALSSGGDGLRHIVRISGSLATKTASAFFAPALNTASAPVVLGEITAEGMSFDATAYIFKEGKSYTGDELVELHIHSPQAIAQKIIELSSKLDGVRIAQAGEFTSRAYFNGKLDIAQAEAVAQIVAASNLFQIQAAQRLLKGRLSEKLTSLHSQTLDLLSLLEAGLDFSEEDITFITESEANRRVAEISLQLRSLIESNIRYERMLGLPAVAIAGCPNAGKSSLMNALLGKDRSIVSPIRATTRDVVSEVLKIDYCEVVLSDCAGVIRGDFVDEIDKIAQEAAIETAKGADILVFCVDASQTDYSAEAELFGAIKDKQEIIALCMKCDTVEPNRLNGKLAELKEIFGKEFVPTNTFDGKSIQAVCKMIKAVADEINERAAGAQEIVAVNRRHYDSLIKTLDELSGGLEQIHNDCHEIAAMYIRSACEQLAGFNKGKSIDEDILDRIFSNFCVGK